MKKKEKKKRTIKFRAWDKKYKKFRDLDNGRLGNDWVWLGNDGTLETIDDIILTQFTGLLDKNGKEIYEMDILKVDWGGIQDEYILNNKYDKPFVMEWRNYEYPPFSRYLPMPKDIEVIGNIYEGLHSGENNDILKSCQKELKDFKKDTSQVKKPEEK